MTITSSLTINLSNPSAASDALLIEQKEWGSVGKVSRASVVKYIGHILYNLPEPILDCGGQNATVYVYLWDKTLEYGNLLSSRGSVSTRVSEQFLHKEIVHFSYSNEARLKYPMDSVKSYEWLGNIYNGEGGIVNAPNVNISDNDVSLSERVHGSLKVYYYVTRHVYRVTVPKLEDATENHYSAVVYAVWAGGVQWLKLTPAPDADEDFDCQNGYEDDDNDERTIFIPPPDDPYAPPYAPVVNKLRHIDYCSQEEIYRNYD